MSAQHENLKFGLCPKGRGRGIRVDQKAPCKSYSASCKGRGNIRYDHQPPGDIANGEGKTQSCQTSTTQNSISPPIGNCSFCKVNPSNYAIYPCGHTACSQCGPKIQIRIWCPNCGKNIKDLFQLYM